MASSSVVAARRLPLCLAALGALATGASIDRATASPQGEPAAAGSADWRAWLVRALDDEVARRSAALGGARVGVAVRDLATGQLLYGHDADGGYNLASNTKLVTAAAALAALGPGFTWRTGLYAERLEPGGAIAGDLYVRGRGNPNLGTEDLDALARDLADAGVTKIQGGLAIDSTYFDAVDTPPHFDEQPDEQAFFRAPIGATSLNFDAVKVTVRPSPTGEGPALAAVAPVSDYVVLDNQVLTVKRGRSRVRITSAVVTARLEITVTGQLRADDGPVHLRRRVPDPAAYLAAVLRERLAAHGVRVASPRPPRLAPVPVGARLLAEHESESLAVVVRDLGKHSNNYVAEMILKTLGAETVALGRRPATWDDGLAAVRRYLTQVVGLPDGSFYVGNGSGLFQASRLSPAQLTRLLVTAHDDFRYGPDLVASLSIAGVDGTLGHRMAAGPAARRVRGKTGTLSGVSTLAGFVAQDDAPPLAFAVLIGGAPEKRPEVARAAQDRIRELLVHYLEAGRGELRGAPPSTAAAPGDAGAGEPE